MKLQQISDELGLEAASCRQGVDGETNGAYVSDLLSDVMANSSDGEIWITLQTHMNIVAVAGMKGLSAIIIVGGRRPADDVLKKAESEGVTILLSKEPAFNVAGRIYQMFNPEG